MNERQIFEGAIEFKSPADRQAFLDKACGSDVALRASVDALLTAHDAASQFLNVPAVEQLQGNDKRLDRTLDHSVAQPNDEVDIDDGTESPDLSFLQPAHKPGSIGSLGHYEILQILGQGAFGVVFRAFDEKLHRQVAVKAMNPQLAATSPPRKRFLREARSVAAIKHENIVQIYSVEEQPLPYLVMEFVQGQTLQQKLDGNGPLEVPEILHLGRQMAAGLAAAHALNMIHRDVKPGNILLEQGAEQKVKITDFGLARAADDASMTRTGVIAGTPMYMSPEQAEGRTLDARSDLFSLGSVLYQMATGRPPFRAPNTIAVLRRVVEDTPRPMAEVIADTPPWLETIVLKLLAKDPEQRFQSAKEVAELFARCQSELQLHDKVTCVTATTQAAVLASESAATTAADKPAAKGNRWLVAAPALVVVCLLGLYLVNRAVDRLYPATTANNPSNHSLGPVTTTTTGWQGWPADAPKPAIAPFNAAQAKKHQQEWADYLKVPVEWENSIGMKFRLIPPGEFLMGATEEEVKAELASAKGDSRREELLLSETPQHRVVLKKPCFLGVHEVTQAEYQRINEKNPSSFAPQGQLKITVQGLDTKRHPVENVSCNDVAKFCATLSGLEDFEPVAFDFDEPGTTPNPNGYHLPTEAQWEFSCRAGTITKYWIGNERVPLVAWVDGGRTKPVGELQANPFGLYDMHGNVGEWVQDCWDPKSYANIDGSYAVDPRVVNDGIDRVCRGGDWGFAGRSASRNRNPPRNHFRNVGFRVALSVAAVQASVQQKNANNSADTRKDYFARNRQAAERAFAVGGEVTVEISKPFEWKTLKAGASLPEQDFVVRMWSIKNSVTATSGDLDVLAGLRHVLQLNLMTKSKLDAEIIPKIAALQSPVKELGIGHLQLKTTELDQLPVMPNVHVLWLSSEQVDDQWKFLGRFPGLRSVELYGAPLPDLSPLGNVPRLRTLRLTAWGELPAADQIRDMQKRNPQLRILFLTTDEYKVLGNDPAQTAARRLIEAGIPVDYFAADGARRELPLAEVEQTVAGQYVVLAIPQGVELTAVLRNLLTHVSLQNLKAEGLREADTLAQLLRDRQDIDHLNLTESDLTDEGLLLLSRLAGLRGLNVNGTQVTAAGVAAFHRAVPGCFITAATGNIDAEYVAMPLEK